MTVYCDVCCKPMNTSVVFFTEGGGALCPEHAPPMDITIRVDPDSGRPLCPKCGGSLVMTVETAYSQVPFYVNDPELGLEYNEHDGDRWDCLISSVYCNNGSCGFWVDVRNTRIYWTHEDEPDKE